MPPHPSRPHRSPRPAAPTSTSAPDGAGAGAGATAAPGPSGPALPRGTVVLLAVAGLVVTVEGMRGISSLLAPVFLGVVLVVAVQPLRRLIDRVAPAWISVAVSLLLVYAVVLGLLAAVGYAVARLAVTLPTYADDFQRLFDQVVSLLSRVGISQAQLNSAVSSISPSNVIGIVQGLYGQFSGALSGLTLLVTVVVFLVADATDTAHRLRVLGVSKPAIARSLGDFASGTRRYLVVTTVFGLIVAVLDTVALIVLGVPLAFLWGLLSFLTNYIPNVGFVLGLIPPALLALLAGGPTTALLVVVIYIVLNVVIQVVLQPRFTGDAIGVTSTVSFLSLVVWAFVLGPLGALLALPLTLFAKALLIDADPRAHWFSVFISADPDPDGVLSGDDGAPGGPDDSGSGGSGDSGSGGSDGGSDGDRQPAAGSAAGPGARSGATSAAG